MTGLPRKPRLRPQDDWALSSIVLFVADLFHPVSGLAVGGRSEARLLADPAGSPAGTACRHRM